MLPRELVGSVAPVAPARPAEQAADPRQQAFAREMAPLLGKAIHGAIQARLTDGTFVVRFADTQARMQLPPGSQVGADVPMTLVGLHPRPTFQVGSQTTTAFAEAGPAPQVWHTMPMPPMRRCRTAKAPPPAARAPCWRPALRSARKPSPAAPKRRTPPSVPPPRPWPACWPRPRRPTASCPPSSAARRWWAAPGPIRRHWPPACSRHSARAACSTNRTWRNGRAAPCRCPNWPPSRSSRPPRAACAPIRRIPPPRSSSACSWRPRNNRSWHGKASCGRASRWNGTCSARPMAMAAASRPSGTRACACAFRSWANSRRSCAW